MSRGGLATYENCAAALPCDVKERMQHSELIITAVNDSRLRIHPGMIVFGRITRNLDCGDYGQDVDRRGKSLLG
jgi:hypothetical protein